MEITGVHKDKEENFVFLVASTLTQAMRIEEVQVTLRNEIIEAKKTTRGEKMTEEAKARRDAISLILSHHTILMKVENTKQAIKKGMGSKNIVSIWFHKDYKAMNNPIV